MNFWCKRGQSNPAGGRQAWPLLQDLTSGWIQPESDNNEHSPMEQILQESFDIVPANHENDTSLWNGLVMGVADCIIYAGLDKIP